MYACPRPGCFGSLVMDWHSERSCTMCARRPGEHRPPTAEESKWHRKEPLGPTFESSAKAGWTKAEDKARRLANKALAAASPIP